MLTRSKLTLIAISRRAVYGQSVNRMDHCELPASGSLDTGLYCRTDPYAIPTQSGLSH